MILPNEKCKIDENSNCENASQHVQSALSSYTNQVNMDCSCKVDHDEDDDDDDNRMDDDDGTVHNCQCNKMLSTHTKLLKNVGKSFR